MSAGEWPPRMGTGDRSVWIIDGEHRRRALEELLKDIRTHDGQEDEE